MKDTFDIRKFLVENKLTENSRGNKGRVRFLVEKYLNNDDNDYTSILEDGGWGTFPKEKASGRGMNVDEIAKVLKDTYKPDRPHFNEMYSWLVKSEVSTGGTYVTIYTWDLEKVESGKMDMDSLFKEKAQEVVSNFKEGTCVEETVGWFLAGNTFYRMLTPEGVREWKEAAGNYHSAVGSYYDSKKSGEYTGD